MPPPAPPADRGSAAAADRRSRRRGGGRPARPGRLPARAATGGRKHGRRGGHRCRAVVGEESRQLSPTPTTGRPGTGRTCRRPARRWDRRSRAPGGSARCGPRRRARRVGGRPCPHPTGRAGRYRCCTSVTGMVLEDVDRAPLAPAPGAAGTTVAGLHVVQRPPSGGWDGYGGPVVIFVHGSLDRAASFAPDGPPAPRLGRGRLRPARLPVLPPGRGGRPLRTPCRRPPGGGRRLRPGRPVTAVGHSVGGTVVMAAAARATPAVRLDRRLRALVAVAGVAPAGVGRTTGDGAARTPPSGSSGAWSGTPPGTVWGKTPGATGGPTARPCWPTSPASAQGALFDAAARHRPHRCSAHGGPASFPHHVETVRLAGRPLLPDARLATVPDAAHGAHLSHPDAFARLIEEACRLGLPPPVPVVRILAERLATASSAGRCAPTWRRPATRWSRCCAAAAGTTPARRTVAWDPAAGSIDADRLGVARSLSTRWSTWPAPPLGDGRWTARRRAADRRQPGRRHPHAGRRRSPGSTPPPAYWSAPRPSATTATGATRSSPRRARRAPGSWPISAGAGRTKRRRRRPACGWCGCGRASSCPPGAGRWPASSPCSGWAWAAGSARGASTSAGSRSTTRWRSIRRAVDDASIAGPVNSVAPGRPPTPASRAALARALRRPAVLAVPAPGPGRSSGRRADRPDAAGQSTGGAGRPRRGRPPLRRPRPRRGPASPAGHRLLSRRVSAIPPAGRLRPAGWLAVAVAGPGLACAAALDPAATDAAVRQDWSPFVLVAGLLAVGLFARDDGLFDAGGAVMARRAARGGRSSSPAAAGWSPW